MASGFHLGCILVPPSASMTHGHQSYVKIWLCSPLLSWFESCCRKCATLMAFVRLSCFPMVHAFELDFISADYAQPHSAYCHTRQVAPGNLEELHATNFVHEVAKLTLRYQAGQSKGAEKLLDQSGLPDEYMDAQIQSNVRAQPGHPVRTICFATQLQPNSQAGLQPTWTRHSVWSQYRSLQHKMEGHFDYELSQACLQPFKAYVVGALASRQPTRTLFHPKLLHDTLYSPEVAACTSFLRLPPLPFSRDGHKTGIDIVVARPNQPWTAPIDRCST